MKKKYLLKIILSFVAFLILGFCIITNTSGDYRIYFASALPFPYRLHSSTPADYIPVVWIAAEEWNNVESSWFEFIQGPLTNTGSPGFNGENLVYFDFVGDNFAPGTNIIAFSQTFTSSAGGYHAVESDYIYNARDFEPGLNGEPGRQDLQSISIHELGHHTGLDHTGLPGGASSGCGPLVPQAVMWAFGTAGDTSRRHLHIEDIMGITACYPNWVIQGTITDGSSSLPISNAEVEFNGTFGTDIGPVINPIGNRRNRIGLVLSSLKTNSDGEFQSVVLNQNFSISADGFGYYPLNASIDFNPPGGFGNTQIIVRDFQLVSAPNVQLQYSLTDTVNQTPVPFSYEIFWMDRMDSALISVPSNPSGNFTETLPAGEYYLLKISIDHPYSSEIIYENLFLPETGLVMNISTKPVSILYVMDSDDSTFEEINLRILKRSNYDFAVLDNNTNPIINTSLESFSHPLTLFWYSRKDTVFTTEEKNFLIEHLRNGGRLVLTGVNVAEQVSDSLMENYIGIIFEANNAQSPVKGFDGDIIGGGITVNAASLSKDRFVLSGNPLGNVYKSFHYGTGTADTSKIAGVRFENEEYNYKGFFLGFGLESISDSSKVDEILNRVFAYTSDTTNTSTSVSYSANLPIQYYLGQNYPNPFNPSTIIRFAVPEREKVELKVFNSLGEEIKTLISKELEAGYHSIEFYGGSLASGVYYYRLKTDRYEQTKKLIILK